MNTDKDRQQQIEAIKDVIDDLYGCDCAYYDVDGLAIAAAIYDAEYRKQLKCEWKLETLCEQGEYTTDGRFRCSNCGKPIIVIIRDVRGIYTFDKFPDFPNYCSNCGAKMQVGDY